MSERCPYYDMNDEAPYCAALGKPLAYVVGSVQQVKGCPGEKAGAMECKFFPVVPKDFRETAQSDLALRAPSDSQE